MATNPTQTSSPPPFRPPTWPGIYPAENPTVMNPPMAIDPNQTPAQPGANGAVLINGYFWCQYQGCGEQIQNAKKDIASHVRRQHDPRSAYQQAHNSGEVQCVWCDRMQGNKASYVGHARAKHGLRGSSNFLRNNTYDDLSLIRKEWIWYHAKYQGQTVGDKWESVLRGLIEVWDLRNVEFFEKPVADDF
ncbi:hypothetical protein F5Y18DRAFT_438118 [Xylariaceae sp. FL1019]|nr:hypothetical protein F5Y18DRAFT_438118 [Xylariaceae sp. FL1019]